MAVTVLDGPAAVRGAVGQHLGFSDWLLIDQERVDQFASATGDHQWIHCDTERTHHESPFGGPIAHGFLTLSLSNMFLPQIVEVTGFAMGINYGTNKVRFMAPVPVGSMVRAGAQLTEVTEIAGGLQTLIVITVEIEGHNKPGCVVQSISRWLA